MLLEHIDDKYCLLFYSLLCSCWLAAELNQLGDKYPYLSWTELRKTTKKYGGGKAATATANSLNREF